MTKVRVSERGQITIPAGVRRKMGIKPGGEVALEMRGDEVVLRPMLSISDVAGIFRDRVRDKGSDWETARQHAEAAVARQVADE